MKNKIKIGYKKIISLIFLILSCSLLFLFYSLVLRPQKDVSIEENRTLQKVPAFSFKKFAHGEFQKEMEDSIGDQMAFSLEIKTQVKKFFNQLTKKTAQMDAFIAKSKEDVAAAGVGAVGVGVGETGINETGSENSAQSVQTEEVQPDKNAYVYKEVVAGKVYKLDDSGYLIAKPHLPTDYDFDIYDPKMLAQVTFPKYLFFIETSESTDFNDIHKNKAFEYIKTQMPMTDYACLSYNSFEEYKRYFYQTDHHWNFLGSYNGYTKIMKMMEGDKVELLRPSGRHTYNTPFNGSRSRDNMLGSATEEFTVFLYKIPPYKTYVNDEERTYGFRYRYISDDDFPHKLYSNHYGLYYGDDRAKVVYKFDQPEKESILILGTSYTNAINELIASHYNETHILDFRYYKQWYGEPINAQKYMEENHLSKLLIIGDISSLGYLRKEAR